MQGTAPSGGIFAPTLRHHDGTFYLITTYFDVISPPDNTTTLPRSFYVHTKDIFDENSWSDPIHVDQYGFDPDLFFDDDGKVYLTTTFPEFVDTGNFANWISEIDIETGNAVSDIRLFHTSTVPKELGTLTEGSHIYKINDWYYLLTADSGTDYNHKANIYRSRSLTGPWKGNPHNPLLWNGEDLSRPVLSTGHADMVEGPDGKWWAVFLATRPQSPTNGTGYPQLGRETFLTPVTWDYNGWPIFNDGKPITIDNPGHLYNLQRPKVWRDDFNDEEFVDKSYYTLRTPYKKFHTLSARPGHLRLTPNIYTLSERQTPAAFLRKQDAINTTASTRLEFDPQTWRHEAGISAYLSIHYHQDIGVTISNVTGHRCVVTHTRTGPNATLNTTYHEDPAVAAGAPVELFIKADSDQYHLGYSVEQPQYPHPPENGGTDDKAPAPAAKKVTYLASMDSRWLQAFVDGWQNFVGTHIALYATSTSLPGVGIPADFDYFQTELN
jgi:beta-xylosidase